MELDRISINIAIYDIVSYRNGITPNGVQGLIVGRLLTEVPEVVALDLFQHIGA